MQAELSVGALQLRTVAETDYPFLRRLYRDVRSQELSATGWPQADIDAFCDAQFALQDSHYRQHYPHACFYVIEQSGEPVGRIYLSDAPAVLGLMEVSLLAGQRGHALGSQLLQWLCALADASARPMELHVEPDNPARRLYARQGFVLVEPVVAGSVYVRMRREPCTKAT